jgi:hypothetical protein
VLAQSGPAGTNDICKGAYFELVVPNIRWRPSSRTIADRTPGIGFVRTEEALTWIKGTGGGITIAEPLSRYMSGRQACTYGASELAMIPSAPKTLGKEA